MKRILTSAPLAGDLGLLLLRVGVGSCMFFFHGYAKLSGGPERWERVGGAMANLGITFAPVFWGFMAAFAEGICSLLLVIGLFTRPAAALLATTMFVAALRHLNLPPDAQAAGWKGAAHAIELFAVFVAIFFAGAGRYRLRAGGWN